ncbi:MAG: CDP-glucose 4,6-dehydratase [Rickettsiales bacterium]|nr:CDP-glucose 4,6-dehydratase [Rickettsiales bacterium]
MVVQPVNDTLPKQEFWSGKRVLLTGHTGFKGAWLVLWLRRLGAEVVGVALKPETAPNLFDAASVADHISENHFCDIRDVGALTEIVRNSRPEVVFHLAAQSLVLTGYEKPLETFDTNVIGTANLLEAVRSSETVRSIVAITTDKVYENNETAELFSETDRLGGRDPYSASKAASELVISCYRSSFLSQRGIAIASARAGNVIGGGDWADNRLIPDAVRAWESDTPLSIRSPNAIRPWQHVLEPLAAYLRLAQRIHEEPELADSYNFGPEPQEAATVREVISFAQSAFGRGDTTWGEVSEDNYEAKWLALETAKAQQLLGIVPRWPLAKGIEQTMAWYRNFLDDGDAYELCARDIEAFEKCVPNKERTS